jgi:DNA-binding NarL/FixJ family response regulator
MRVLIVEGHAGVRERLAALVAEIPGVGAVLEAQSEAEATARIVDHRPEVIVLDLRLGECRGPALVVRLRRKCPTATFVALTTELSPGLERAYTELGVDHVLDKSKDLPSLEAAIEGRTAKLVR